ncbi:unnamed protein product [Rotaria sp. Silwood2]|nr:unnamed protein product [Rotaria sp. Silwood2]CAF4569364.1 unnamed protein product [Rotaria sp. Silwood2]CAF4660805.1 unnamed protein product [Rotaria sp. Silwood2]
MTAITKSYLEILPAEIIHRIYDELDAETILFSVRCVCRGLHSTTNEYNRYRFNFRYMSRSDFRIIPRLIDPKNIISLTLMNSLYNFGQIRLFLSCFHLNQFVRLSSLTLIDLNEEGLHDFQEYITKCCLTEVSILSFGCRSQNIQKFLSSLLSLNTLRKLVLNLGYYDIDEAQWFVPRRVENLTLIGPWNWSNIYFILNHSPHLRTLIVRDFSIDKSDESIITQSGMKQFDHLTSFSLYTESKITIYDMKTILKCFPNLAHMRLFDGNYETVNSSFNPVYQTDSSLFDGYEWECFIETQLSRLKQFEFYFSRFALSNENYMSTMRSLIAPFRTPFWLENKHWTANMITNTIKNLRNVVMI